MDLETNNSATPSQEHYDAQNDGVDENTGLNYKEWNGIDELESMCMRCGETGKTRFMLHKIPFFRELILASFICEECGERNNEVTFGGEIQLQGSIFNLYLTCGKDLDRQIIKSDSASIKIKEIDFEIPPLTQKGEINTIEGILRTASKNLQHGQPLRMIDSPEIAQKVGAVISKLNDMADGTFLPFTLLLDDPAGNSFIQNLHAPKVDPHMSVHHYQRTAEQDAILGLDSTKGTFKDDTDSTMKSIVEGRRKFGEAPTESKPEDENNGMIVLGRTEAVSIASLCPNCSQAGESLTALTDIPHFKEVILMSFGCQFCGFRTNDIKAGGAVPTFGTEVRLKVTSSDDLKRDLLKSDSAMIEIPELELELEHGSLGGLFTTVEGVLRKIYKNLCEQNPFGISGDSASLHHSADNSISETKLNFDKFLSNLLSYADGKVFPFTLIVRDPLGNSFISAPLGSFLPPESDSNLEMIDFERSYEENEEFGLNDINTRDFETGVNESEGPVLPDRLQNNYLKGPDHPTPFAKGTEVNDNTDGGLKLSHKAETETHTNEAYSEEDMYCKPPPGWSAERVDEEDEKEEEQIEPVIHRRQLEGDSHLDFIPYETFSGNKPGYIFRLGSKGIGYYQDQISK